MYKRLFIILVFSFLSLEAFSSQSVYTIQCHVPASSGNDMELRGMYGSQEFVLSKAKSDAAGNFTLTYPADYIGEARIYMNGAYQNLLLLNKENMNIRWDDMNQRDQMHIEGSKENEAFLKGMKIFQDCEPKLAGLNYLVPLYANDMIKQQWLADELKTIVDKFPLYVKSLPHSMFAQQYLLTRGLITEMPQTVQSYGWRVEQNLMEFTAIDFKALKHSGLYKDLIEGYTQFTESLEPEKSTSVLNQGIDKMISELKDDPTIQQEVAQQWFTFLEQRSQFLSAEHLALAMLNDDNCMLSNKNKAMFEQYRKLAVGKTASDIDLGKGKKLSTLNGKYKLVIFGASWCPNCQQDYPKLKEMYVDVKNKYDLEMVYVSIDTDPNPFANEFRDAPFVMYCDFKGWETQAVKDYCVFATPTYVLLDNQLKILAKIKSPEHLKAWLEAFNPK